METLVKTTYPKPSALLAHRPPMLLIDEILDYQSGISLTAAKRVEKDEIFFKGHFPDNPILPGVVMIEMMFQACGLYGRMDSSEALGKSGRAIKVTDASFSQEVSPDTDLTIHIRFKHKIMKFSVYEAVVRSEEGVAAKATITATIS